MRRSILLVTMLATLLLGAGAAGAGQTDSRLVDSGALGPVLPKDKRASTSTDGQVAWHNGPVLHAPTAYALYWMPDGYSFPAGYRTAMSTFFADMQATNGHSDLVNAVASQYGDASGPASADVSFAGGYIDSNPFQADCTVPGFDTCVSAARILTHLKNDGVTSQLGGTGYGSIYFVFLPPGVAVCNPGGCSPDDFCAYHGYGDFADGQTVLYAVIPVAAADCAGEQERPNGSTVDDSINAISHEWLEAVTDPHGTGWWVGDRHFGEIGDKCEGQFENLGSTQYGAYDQAMNGGYYMVQGEWSNLDQGCVLALPPGPRIWGFSPADASAGDKVTIKGARLDTVKSVTLAGQATPFSYKKGTIYAYVPDGALSGRLRLSDGENVALAKSTLTVVPTITKVSPKGGGPGTVVTIDGTGFAGAGFVGFGGAGASFTIVSPKRITATVPDDAAAGSLVVANFDDAEAAAKFKVAPAAPVVNGFSASHARVGDTVAIYGTHLLGTTSVTFNSIKADEFTVVSPVEVDAVVPAKGNTGLVKVTTGGGSATGTQPFVVDPTISSFSPASASIGKKVTIRGGGFTNIVCIFFGNGLVTDYDATPDKISARVPSTATTGPIIVITDAGVFATTTQFVVTT